MITLHLTKHQTDVLNFSFDRGQSATHTQKKTRKCYEYLLVLMQGNFTTFSVQKPLEPALF